MSQIFSLAMGLISPDSPISLISPEIIQIIGHYNQIESNMINFKHQIQNNTVMNPKTGRMIKVNSVTYNKLCNDHIISYYTNVIPFMEDEQQSPYHGPCRSCHNQQCLNNSGFCCWCRDLRPMLIIGPVCYAFRDTYINGRGKQRSLTYCWLDYCPSCVIRGYRHSGIKDRRAWNFHGNIDALIVDYGQESEEDMFPGFQK